MLILKHLTSLHLRKKIKIYNFGNYVRDFTYVEDVVNSIVKIHSKNFNLTTLNICASKPKKIIDILYYISKKNNKKLFADYYPKRKGEMLVTYGSNEKLKKKLE